MSAAERSAALDTLGVAQAARWAWSDSSIRRALARTPETAARLKLENERREWDRLIAFTERRGAADLMTACLSWLDPADLDALARVGINGFGGAL